MNDPATAAAATAASAPPADPSTAAAAGGGWRAEVAFLRRVLIVAAVVALLLLLWQVRFALLLVFGAVVVAVALLAAAEPLEDRLGLPRPWSLAAVGGAKGLALVLAALLVGGEVQAQASQLAARLPEAVRAVEQRFGVELPGGGDAGWPADGGLRGSWVGEVARRFAAVGPVLLNALAAVALAVVGGFFMVADPDVYVRGAVKLVPHRQHARAGDALRASGRALRLWLRAQLAAMALVGALTGLGAWAIGLPAPLALGLFAAVAEFVPLVGPVAAAVPALLLALGQGGGAAVLWTGLLYLAVQQLESNLLTPLLGQRLVSVPPALLLFAVAAAGAVLGLGGVVLAAPLTVVAYVMVQTLYVRQTLGEPVRVPGEELPTPPEASRHT